MLDYVRKRANSPVVKIGAGLIALTFFIGFGILTGIRRASKMGSGVVAEVNDEPIYIEDYNLVLGRLIDAYRKRFGDSFNEEFMKKVHFREQVLFSLIVEKLKAQEAKRLGIDIDDTTLMEYIASIPAFQYGGRFNQRLYQDVLRNARPPMTPAQFEKEERERLNSQRFENFVKYTWFIEDEELFELFYAENEKVNLYYVKFSPQEFEGRIKVTTKEAEEYYSSHKEDFKTGPLRKVKYVFVPFLNEKNSVTEEMIKDYYEKHKEEFKHGEQVKASHILIKVPPGATTEEVNAAREKAFKILKLAKKSKNFSALARKYSEGPSARRGGELGWFGRGEMVKAFEEAAFNATTGEVTGPVRTQFGFHIIKVEAKRGPGISPLKEVENRIRFELTRELLDKRKEEIRKAADSAIKSGDLQSFAKEFGVKIKETPYFDRDHIELKEIEDEKSFKEKVFSQKETDKPFKVETLNGVYLVEIVGEKPPYQQTFPEVKEKIIEKIRRDKAKIRAAEKASKFLSLLRKYGDIHRVARMLHLRVEETGDFTPVNNSIPGIGKSDELRKTAFRLSEKNPIPDQVFTVGDNFFVVQLKKHHRVTQKEFLQKKAEIEKKYREKNSERIMEKWLRYLQEEGEIEIHREAIQPPGGAS